jgi:phenylacetate-CoA ligase
VYPELFRHVLFPAYETLTRRGTHRFLAEYRRTQWLDAETIARIQLEKLNTLIEFCWQQVPYLEKCWREAGLKRRPLGSVRELEYFPILTKGEITANYLEMTSLPWRGRSLVKTTGGTTGDPFRFEYTMESYARRTASMWRGYEWAGAGLGARTAYLWGSPTPKEFRKRVKEGAYHWAFNRRVWDANSMLKERDIEAYARAMDRYRPDVLVGFVRPVLAMARWIAQTGHKAKGLRSVVTGAEALYESERREIEGAFGCPVFNTYGCREFMLIAAECERHAGLHINADHLVVELVDSAGREAMEEPGDVIITDLHNFAMPFVRYRNGDRATAMRGSACACGRGLPLLQSVEGRILDMILTPDGRHVPGEFFVYVMLGRTAISRYQVVQVANDALEVRIMSDTKVPDSEFVQIAEKISEVTGPAMRISVVPVNAIAEPASGKRRVTVSLESFRAQHPQLTQ